MESKSINIPTDSNLKNAVNITAMAIEEGRKIAFDTTAKGYTNMEDLKKALESDSQA